MLVASGVRFATSARSPNPCSTTSLKPRQTCQRIWGANRQASDHELAEPLSVGVAGGLGILLKPFRCSVVSSFIAFSTDRSIPRSSKPQAATTAAQSRTNRPRAVAVALRPMTTGAASASRKSRRSRAGFLVGRPPRFNLSTANQVLIGWLIFFDQEREQFGTVLKPDSPSLMLERRFNLRHPEIRIVPRQAFNFGS